jgi:hypothetical protein
VMPHAGGMSLTHSERPAGPILGRKLGSAELVWDADDNPVLTCQLVHESALHWLLGRLLDLGCLLLTETRSSHRGSSEGAVPEVVQS